MSLATGLIAKLLLAISVIPAAGYGGYCAYDHYCPTFHNFMEREGFMWSPIDEDMKIGESWGLKRKDASEKMGGGWRCTKQLFDDLTPPTTDTSGADKGEADSSDSSKYKGHDTPAKTTVQSNDWSDEDSVGCLVTDLGHSIDNKRNGFIKWELALRSGNRGFIYVGYISFGATQDEDYSSDDKRHAQISFSLVFEVSRKSGTWKIGKGFTWSDAQVNNAGDVADGKVVITLPDGNQWRPQGGLCTTSCSPLDSWTFQKYVGFWEYKTDGDKQPTDALNIQIGNTNKNTDKHDVWQTESFDFKKSNQEITDNGSTQTAWSSSIGYWYDDSESKWKAAELSKGDKGYLEEIYKPWANKKGTWMEAEKVCYASNSRTLKETDEEAKRLKNFCYKNKK